VTRETKKGVVDVIKHEPFHILAAFEHKSGEVNFTRSYWIPEQGRWNMFSKKEGTTQPFAFIPVDELNAYLLSLIKRTANTDNRSVSQ
jgi:hypothetical protein